MNAARKMPDHDPVASFATAMVQRGIVTREQEPALHGLVSEVLEQLAAE